jgi:molecular chaperone DnaK (HSP70)
MMLGINMGSLSTTVAIGQKHQSALLFKTELLLSETSSRICPSLISFGGTHRVIGDQASLVIKKNLKSSFQFIDRFIGFDINVPFYSHEMQNYFYVGDTYDKNKNQFSYMVNGEKKYIFPEEIVVSFLHLLYNSYIIQKNLSPACKVFSVPDYFTCFQKNKFMQIIKSTGLEKDFHLVNESSAITLYFGYKKYKEYFIRKNAENPSAAAIDPSITKYILFIDAGHSKTSLIFSRLNYNLFKVLDTLVIPFLGGRDFDDAIFKYCCEKFKNEHNIDLLNDKKAKLRLIQPIMKARKNLTVNKDSPIAVDSLVDDIDFYVLLSRDEFEKIIKDKIDMFRNELIHFCQRNNKNYPGIQLTNVEMAGELMRTPSMEKAVKEILNMEMSKTILTDECISVGSSLYGSLLQGSFPIKNFKGIYHLNHYSILYSINNNEIKEFVDDHHQIPEFKSLSFGEEYFNGSNNNLINITFYHKKEEIQNYVSCNDSLLISYDINLLEVLKANNGVKNLKIVFLIDNIGEIHIKSFESTVDKNKPVKIDFNKRLIKVVKRGLYPSKVQIDKNIDLFTTKENDMFRKDQEFIDFSFKKNNLESKLYNIKGKIQYNNELNSIQYNNKNVLDCLQEIEDKLYENHENIFDLAPLENYFDGIIKELTPKTIIQHKENMSQQINNYINIMNQEKEKLANNQPSKYTKNSVTNALNMLENFKNKLYLILDPNELYNLNTEFENEKMKYFN